MFDDRFARQKRFGPPSGFPLTSTWPGIVHHLSGPNKWSLLILHDTKSMEDSGVAPVKDHPSSTSTLCFHCAFGFTRPNDLTTC